MVYQLACDSCEFGCTVDEEGRAFVVAGEHEGMHAEHFVVIETVEERV